ncbi:hypothetical protein [Salinicoccus kekensis]|uniref:Activator of Hsp90 ATPase-like protein n=1 Tax=Salinicoccus kekensis TaxID=714307 RepID=A0A285UMI9_9STAP|nr:hypothetical protein [Salinicoccus kekensis]SOC43134.1 hypothetical protein SAMN05878391_1890 [Salinicoccus kekensis]
MNTEYSTNEYNAYQKLEIDINATTEDIFYFFGTTEGSKKWFPELTFEDEPRPEKLFFEKGDGTHDHLYILDYAEPRRLMFTWDPGDVSLEVHDIDEDNVRVTFEERMPLAFKGIVKDFTGWYFQIENLKHIAETGELKEMDEEAFQTLEKKVREKLGR